MQKVCCSKKHRHTHMFTISVQNMQAVRMKVVQYLQAVCKMYAKSVFSRFLPPQALYFGIKHYYNNIDSADREAIWVFSKTILVFSKKQHREHMDDFKELWVLHTTKKAAATNCCGRLPPSLL